MADRNMINKLGMSGAELDEQVNKIFGPEEDRHLQEVLKEKVDGRVPGAILTGKIVSKIGNDVIVEVGLKSEGIVDAGEFDSEEDMEVGRRIEVFLEDTDSESGLVLLSKRKADRIRGWEKITSAKKEGDIVTGRVIRRIKGGLLVDIGVPVFLPASQVDIRRPGDISRFIGKEVKCSILKIDVDNRNIVLSRRKLIEQERQSGKEKILAEIEVGQRRKGIVKNIADFGAFVDLGGLDGLLHISDMSWGRITHPSEMLKLDQEIECVVLSFDKASEKISLGLKQKTASPWETVEENYPVESRVKGTVVNITNYGAFVKIEEGLEGLLHISEMSWTKRLSHPGEMLNIGDEIEVVVLDVSREKQEMSLGLKQIERNPWSVAFKKYPPGTIITAKVRSLTRYGAFAEIEPGIEGMIHISEFSWTKKFNHPGEMLKRGDEVKCVVLDVEESKQRISLGIKQLTEDPWLRAIPEKYIPGHIVKCTITKITPFGAFVELEPTLEGLLHISELADHKVETPEDVVKIGEQVDVKILRVDSDSRKIGLSLRRAKWAAEEADDRFEPAPLIDPAILKRHPAEDKDAAAPAAEQVTETVKAADEAADEAAVEAPAGPRDDAAEPAEPGEKPSAGDEAAAAPPAAEMVAETARAADDAAAEAPGETAEPAESGEKPSGAPKSRAPQEAEAAEPPKESPEPRDAAGGEAAEPPKESPEPRDAAGGEAAEPPADKQ
jgi:small subunit ribosomal protein S1